MTDDATPREVGSHAGLGLAPERDPLPHVPPLPFAVFDEFGRGADDRVHAYAIVHAAAAVAEERERIRALVEAVRDENAASQDADDCLIYTPALQRAWEALMAGLEGPNEKGNRPA